MDMEVVATTETTDSINIQDLKRKMKVSGRVVKITLAGAVVDIGVSVPGVIHISQLQAEATNRVEDVVQPGQEVEVWIKRVDLKKNRIELTMIPPLDLEWREIEKGMVLKGKITRLEKFGAFVDIGAERPGLIHISEMTHGYIKTPGEVVNEGEEVEVKVLDYNRRKKQIKLSMKALEDSPVQTTKSSQPRRVKDKEPAVEIEPEEPVPTAMEVALREAMERNKTQENPPKPKSRRKSSLEEDAMGDILNRTLENKVQSTK